ncbi:MAG: copper chaperone PCu(A)C [Gammaproteobacteria bacterium]
MNNLAMIRYLIVTLLIVFSFPSTAGEYRTADLTVVDPWSRPLPEVSVNGAAYMGIHNQGTKPDRIIGAVSEIAEKVEIHNHINQDGLMKMVHLEQGAELPPGEMVMFQPGGLHVMLLGLTSPLKDGLEYKLTLLFEVAGELKVVVRVEDRESSGMNHSSHMNKSEEGQAHSYHVKQTGASD